MYGVLLYGPPAAGKDTVTAALHDLEPMYVLFQRLKAGPGRSTGYRMTKAATIDDLRQTGNIVWENRRYGSVYAIDRPSLLECLQSHAPVVHLGQSEAVDAVIDAAPASWLVVSLWCARETARARLIARGATDIADRLRAWDETPPPMRVDLAIDTGHISPADAARQIHRLAPLHCLRTIAGSPRTG
jgi:guanylate kinase